VSCGGLATRKAKCGVTCTRRVRSVCLAFRDVVVAVLCGSLQPEARGALCAGHTGVRHTGRCCCSSCGRCGCCCGEGGCCGDGSSCCAQPELRAAHSRKGAGGRAIRAAALYHLMRHMACAHADRARCTLQPWQMCKRAWCQQARPDAAAAANTCRCCAPPTRATRTATR
jgi:hypothetical protein